MTVFRNKQMNYHIASIFKVTLTYCILSGLFSIIGIFLSNKAIPPYPLTNGSFSLEEILGHFVFGIIAGAVTLNFRYILLAGFFPVFIDSDHIINLFQIEAISRMSHSISFGIFSLVVMMLLFGKRDYLLGSIAFGSVFSHIAYDVFYSGDPGPPLFVPFYDKPILIPSSGWIFFECIAIIMIGIGIILTKKKILKNNIK